MQKARIITGRLVGPVTVQLDEPAIDVTAQVEVLVRDVPQPTAGPAQSLTELLESFPPGTRSKMDIDKQIHEERDSWGDR